MSTKLRKGMILAYKQVRVPSTEISKENATNIDILPGQDTGLCNLFSAALEFQTIHIN